MKKQLFIASLCLSLFLFAGCQSQPQDAEVATAPVSEEATPSESETPQSPQETDPGQKQPEFSKLPEFTINDYEGNEVSINDYEGQVVLLNFWASWCKFCVEEMPDLQTLDEDEDISVLTINVGEDQQTAAAFMSENELSLPLYSDLNGSLFASFSGTGLPLNVFIGSDRELYTVHRGMLTKEQIDNYMASIRALEAEK